MTPLQVACVAALTGVGLALTAPQTLKLSRGRVGAGVSVPGLICSVLSYAAWAGYAAGLHDRVFLASLLLPAALELLTLGLGIRYRGSWHGWWVAPAWAGTLVLAAAAGPAVLGTLLAVSILWEYGPATWESWRAPDVSGVSVLAWRLRVADGVVWTAYGALIWNAQLLVAGVSAGVLAVVVLAGLRLPASTRALRAAQRPAVGLDPHATSGSMLDP